MICGVHMCTYRFSRGVIKVFRGKRQMAKFNIVSCFEAFALCTREAFLTPFFEKVSIWKKKID